MWFGLDAPRHLGSVGEGLGELAWGMDTVNVCLSKGLGAPMGSVLCGTRDNVVQVRWARKMLGGGVRQARVLAGLVALDYLPRIPEDRAKARHLADCLRAMGFTGPVPRPTFCWCLCSAEPFSTWRRPRYGCCRWAARCASSATET